MARPELSRTRSLAIVVASVLVGSLIASTSGAAPVRPTLYVASSGSPGGSCRQADPCSNFDRAYALAWPGSVVRVAGGAYGSQSIVTASAQGGPKVVFEPASRARVTVRSLRVEAGGMEFRNMTFDDLDIGRNAKNVVFRNITNHGLFMQGPQDITFLGGEVTCGVCSYHSHLDDGGPPDYRPPRNIVFDGVYFHDWQAAAPGQHTECLQILAGDGITIRNSVFKDCATAFNGRGATADLHVSWLGNGPKTRNILIENNFFYKSGNPYAIQSADWTNLDIRYNSIVGPILIYRGWGEGAPVHIVGNIMGYSTCEVPPSAGGEVSQIVFRYNVLSGGKCGPTDTNAASGFIDPARDLHLKRTSPAIGRGDLRDYPKRDIDGQRRPLGKRPDAGADEVP